MKQSNTSRYAYLAGLIDGEGCIAICRDTRNVAHFFVMLSISNTDGAVMDWLKGTFGGTIYFKRNKGFHYSTIPLYEWRVYHAKAVPIIEHVLPFLRIKKQQAEIWLRMASHLYRKGRTGGSIEDLKPVLSEHEIQLRQSLWEECSRLKHRHATACHSVSITPERTNLLPVGSQVPLALS